MMRGEGGYRGVNFKGGSRGDTVDQSMAGTHSVNMYDVLQSKFGLMFVDTSCIYDTLSVCFRGQHIRYISSYIQTSYIMSIEGWEDILNVFVKIQQDSATDLHLRIKGPDWKLKG